jgi:membrane-associated phospholipid phosphatase
MANREKQKYSLVEKATFIYITLLSLIILIFHANIHNWVSLLVFNFGVCVAIVFLVKWLGNGSGRWFSFFRHWYPFLFFFLFYEETRYLIHLVFPYSFDFVINRFELAVFGVYPTVWLQKFISFGLNEYFMFSYSTYYFFLLVLGLVLYFGKKIKEFDDLIFTCAVTYYVSFLCFVLFPVEGPRFALQVVHQVELSGGFFTWLTRSLVDKGGMQGAAMPSSHVAIALVVLIYAKRHHRILYYVFLPLVISLFISTVYGRFHYVSDVAAGILVGMASIFLCDRLIGKQVALAQTATRQREFSLDLATHD